MFSGMLVADTMQDFLAKIFRLPSNGKPISIIDTSAMPSEITSVVVSVLSRLVFDYAIWARQEPQRPILLFCEEAHRYIPNTTTGSGPASASVAPWICSRSRTHRALRCHNQPRSSHACAKYTNTARACACCCASLQCGKHKRKLACTTCRRARETR